MSSGPYEAVEASVVLSVLTTLARAVEPLPEATMVTGEADGAAGSLGII